MKKEFYLRIDGTGSKMKTDGASQKKIQRNQIGFAKDVEEVNQ